MVAGNPARVVGRTKYRRPALFMRTKIETRGDSKEFCEIYAKAINEDVYKKKSSTMRMKNRKMSSALEDEPLSWPPKKNDKENKEKERTQSYTTTDALIKRLDE